VGGLGPLSRAASGPSSVETIELRGHEGEHRGHDPDAAVAGDQGVDGAATEGATQNHSEGGDQGQSSGHHLRYFGTGVRPP